MSAQHTVLVVGGNGFLGSAISKQALAKGWRVISISPSGRPYLSPAGHRPAWSSSPEIEWHAADALDPSTYKHLASQCTAAVHTVGILLESDYKLKSGNSLFDAVGGALKGVAKGWGYSVNSSNPLKDGVSGPLSRKWTYEVMNRDTAISVAHTFLFTLQSKALSATSTPAAPFIYISAEDLFRPIVDPRYISTKREAEKMITFLSERYGQKSAGLETEPSQDSTELPKSDGASLADQACSNAEADGISTPLEHGLMASLLRPVFLRPGLMYHPHTRPIMTLPAAILELSAALHKSPPLPLPLPTPASLLSSSLTPASFRPLAKLLTTPPLHIDTVAKAVCKSIEDDSVRGPVDVYGIRHLAGWKGDEAAHVTSESQKHSHAENPFSSSNQPQKRNMSTVSRRPSGQPRSIQARQSSVNSLLLRRNLFGLSDLGKLAVDTISGGKPDNDKAQSFVNQQGRQVYKTEKVLEFPSDLLYSVVADVNAYNQFVPYCQASKVFGPEATFQEMKQLGQSPTDGATNVVLAELQVGFGSFHERYTSQVRMKQGHWVKAQAQQPNPVFSHLSTTWTFAPVVNQPGATMVQFELCYKFKNPLYGSVAGSVFESMSGQMIDAFETRAGHVLGLPKK